MKKFSNLVLFSLLVFACPARAQAESVCKEDISYLFCESMENPEQYEENALKAYKMLIYGKDGWIFRTETDLKKDFTLPPATLDQMTALSRAFEARGTKLVMLYVPTRGMMHHEYLLPEAKWKYSYLYPDQAWKSYAAAIETLKGKGIHTVGLAPPKEKEAAFFYKRDHHWNAEGAKRSAEALATYIKTMPEYQSIPQTSFTTKKGDRFAFYGVSKKVFKKLCDTIQPPELVNKYETERTETSSMDDDLFGAAEQPDIVLMGTSNSTREPTFANFEGFLKESLSADILNVSVSGGGLDTAMISYLNSDAYKQNPPKIAIWEVPSYYDLTTHPNFFREAIPAIAGDCGNEAVAQRENIPLEGTSTFTFRNLAGANITGDNYYLHLTFSRPVSAAFSTQIFYQKGYEKYKFQRARATPDREFYLNFGAGREFPLDRIVLTVPDRNPDDTATIQVCRKPEPLNG